MAEELKSKIVWQEDKDFGKVCTLTESALNGIINEATKELQEELEDWKAEWQEQAQKATDEGYARTLQTMQLNKAKDLLKQWVELYKPKLEGYPITPIQKQTEQFLNSEVEK